MKAANTTAASLCKSGAGENGSVSFSFDHGEPGRGMHGSVALGQASTLHAHETVVVIGAHHETRVTPRGTHAATVSTGDMAGPRVTLRIITPSVQHIYLHICLRALRR